MKKMLIVFATIGLGLCLVLVGLVPGLEYNPPQNFQYSMSLAAMGCALLLIAVSSADAKDVKQLVSAIFHRFMMTAFVLMTAWITILALQQKEILIAACMSGLFLLGLKSIFDESEDSQQLTLEMGGGGGGGR
jgi:hypothetical protein